LVLQRDVVDVNLADLDGANPLWRACQNGHTEVVDSLLTHGQIDINKPDSKRCTSFWIACQNGHEKVVKLLLKRSNLDINMNWLMSTRSTPIQQAAYSGRSNIVRLLLTDSRLKKAELRWTPLHLAVVTQNLDLFYQALKPISGLTAEKLNARDSCGYAPMHYLSGTEWHLVIRRFTLFPDVDLNALSPDNESPLYVSAETGHTQTIKWLLASSKEIGTNNMVSSTSQTPAMAAENFPENFDLIKAYQKEPKKVTKRLRKEMQVDELCASDLLVLVLFYSDGYLFSKDVAEESVKKFFEIAKQLPLELQMAICNLCFSVDQSFVHSKFMGDSLQHFIRML